MERTKQFIIPIKNDFIKNIKQYYVFIIVIVLYLAIFEILDPHGPNCIIKHTIGVPCMGCGMTRATYYLITLDFKQAFFFHPLVFIMPVIITTFLLKGIGIFQTMYSSKTFWGVVIFLFVATYIIRMYLYYPDTPPMDHYFG